MVEQGQAVGQKPAGRRAWGANQNGRKLVDETALVLFDVGLEEEDILNVHRVYVCFVM